MATKADLRRMVLLHLTVIDATENPDAEQSGAVDLWIDGARGQLRERGLVWWDENDIPLAVTVPLTTYIAAIACKAFGRGGKGYEEEKIPARGEIAALKSSEERETIRGEYS